MAQNGSTRVERISNGNTHKESTRKDTAYTGLDQSFIERINKENRRTSVLHELYYYMLDDPSLKKCMRLSKEQLKHVSR